MKLHGILYYLFLSVLPDQRTAHHEISLCSRWPSMRADKVPLRCKDRTFIDMRFCTSTYRHLSCPSAVALADSVFRTPCQEVAMLTAVHQSVAKTRQVHPHHVHMEWALWLLTGMRWRVEKGFVQGS